MGLNVINYALMKKNVKAAVSGIKSYSVSGTDLIIELDDGSMLTMTFPNPIGVERVSINEENHLIITLTDGTEQDAGMLQKGDDGFSPVIVPNSGNTDTIYKLDITTKDGTTTTPNLKGSGGSGADDIEIKDENLHLVSNGIKVGEGVPMSSFDYDDIVIDDDDGIVIDGSDNNVQLGFDIVLDD